MVKDYYELLDKCLDFLYNQQHNNPNMINDMEHLLASLQNVTQSEHSAAFKKLKIDGYIDEDKRITFEGYVFIQDGGYTQQKANESIELRYKNWTTFALIFGGLAAGIYYIVYLISFFETLFCH